MIDKTYPYKNLNSPSLTSSKNMYPKTGIFRNKFSHGVLMYGPVKCHNEINDIDN